MRRRVQGLNGWILQRISAVYLAVFVLFVVIWFYCVPRGSLDYQQWRALFVSPVVNVFVALFFASLFVHVWVGVRDIVIDYIHPFALRFLILVAVGLGLCGMGVWVLIILLPVAVP